MSQDQPKLEPCSFADFGQLDYGFAKGTLPKSEHAVLLIRFAGDAEKAGSSGRVLELASAIVSAAMELWQPSAVILDVQKLAYEWGDGMLSVLGAPQRWYKAVHPMRVVFSADLPARIPLAVVASDANREGLLSLVDDEMDLKPADILYDSIADAARALDAQLVGILPV
jgi:hypothetical protein